MKKLLSLPFLAFLLIANLAQAQDPYFSQFYANKVYLNPAYAGFDGDNTININYRDQWFGVPDGDIRTLGDSYRTYSVSYDMQKPCYDKKQINLGASISLFRDEAGKKPLVNQGAALGFSYEKGLVKGSGKKNLKRLDLRAGFQLSYMQKLLRGGYLIYSDQLDPIGGLITDPSFAWYSSRIYPNINAGVMLRGYHEKSKYRNMLFTLGFAISNANEPNESILGSASVDHLPRRYTLHGGLAFRISSFEGVSAPVFFAPQFRWDWQAKSTLNLQTLGFYILSKGYYGGLFAQYNFPFAPSKTSPSGGNFISRNTTTATITGGIDLKYLFDWGVPGRKRKSGIVLGLSYDINLSGLDQSNTLGVLEMNLRMSFVKDRRRAKRCGEIAKSELYRGKCPVEF